MGEGMRGEAHFILYCWKIEHAGKCFTDLSWFAL